MMHPDCCHIMLQHTGRRAENEGSSLLARYSLVCAPKLPSLPSFMLDMHGPVRLALQLLLLHVDRVIQIMSCRQKDEGHTLLPPLPSATADKSCFGGGRKSTSLLPLLLTRAFFLG